MKISRKVPKHQKAILDYMISIDPVLKTLEDLIEAVLALSRGAHFETLPKSVQVNKAFDGGHSGSETAHVMRFVRTNKTLCLRVQRGYLAMEQGDRATIIASQLAKSQEFHVAFVSPKKVSNGETSWNDGFKFVICRDGTLKDGMSSASGVMA
jgi:hypothetical protein